MLLTVVVNLHHWIVFHHIYVSEERCLYSHLLLMALECCQFLAVRKSAAMNMNILVYMSFDDHMCACLLHIYPGVELLNCSV